MLRTVVYDSPEVQAHYTALAQDKNLAAVAPGQRRKLRADAVKKAATQAAPSTTTQPEQADSLPTKLVKYVPAEVVAVSAAGFAAFNPTGDWIWFGVALGAVANVLYLFVTAQSAGSAALRPRSYFYLLSAGAFVVWAIATITSIRTAMHLNSAKADFILFAGAFGIPLLDSLFGVLYVSPKGAPAHARTTS